MILRNFFSANKKAIELILSKKCCLDQYFYHFGRIFSLINDYDLSTSKYIQEGLYDLSELEWKHKTMEWEEEKKDRRAKQGWRDLYYADKMFFNEYSQFKYECSSKMMDRRIRAFNKRYNVPLDSYVGHGCVFRCSHYIKGYQSSLTIGHHVLLTENVFIDYTGKVSIGDGTTISNGVIIETHERDFQAWYKDEDVNVPNELQIGEKVFVGSRAIILSGCHSIGDRAIVAAGAVVTKDVPANCVVAGVPAIVIKQN